MLIAIFSLIPLLVAFGILGMYDILGNKRIGLKVMLFFVIAFLLIALYQWIFAANFSIIDAPQWEVIATIVSMAVLLAIPKLGFGDKLFLIAAFLVYPFWMMWIIIIIAKALTGPLFKLIFFFKKSGRAALPFFPFLFLAAAIVYLVNFYL